MDIDNNSKAIIILCSHLCIGKNIKPLEPREWDNLENLLFEKNIKFHELLNFSRDDFEKKLFMQEDQINRIENLISRSASITFDLEKLSKYGIRIITKADEEYPKLLKDKLGKSCPPLFYCAGNIKLLDNKLIGFVGSRSVLQHDINFTKAIVAKVIENNMGIVSGGARGIDSIASEEAILRGGYAVEFISDSLLRKLKKTKIINDIRNGKLLILSVAKPDAGFNIGFAMMRNKYIYASSEGTLVVKSDFNKGGTWSGAMENLKRNWTNTFCWNNSSYEGNIQLIKNGAIPIDINWDVDINIEKENVPGTKTNFNV